MVLSLLDGLDKGHWPVSGCQDFWYPWFFL